MKKKILLTAAAVVVLLVAAVAAGSFYLVNYALVDAPRHRDSNFNRAIANYPELRTWIDSLQAEGALRDTFVVMPTGERAHAIFARSSKAHGATAVLVHGYTDNATSMLMIARIYNHFLNYNILLPDLHAHGQSYGNDIQMGWKDRLDVMHWIGLAPGMFRTPADSMRLVVHGISMGAATTMCVSGEHTPDYVKCFVEDCGYTSVWDEFAHELKGRFSLPEFPLLYTASWVVRMKYGWSFGEASPLKQVAKCRKPMFFIHGDNDTYVPTAMVYPLYEAKPQPKQLWIAPGSKHALSYRDHKAEYVKKVTEFVSKWNGAEK